MGNKKNRFRKADNIRVTKEFLQKRIDFAKEGGFAKARWIEFCEKMMDEGFYVTLYEARKTFSKYITVIAPYNSKYRFKVRFSNHRPIKRREEKGDCDFFVGVTNLAVTTTEQAMEATLDYFKNAKEKENAKNENVNDDSLKHRPFERLSDQ